MHDPIAYTYEADTHCEGCAVKRFGRDDDGFITGTDNEGNQVGVIAPWDEWCNYGVDDSRDGVHRLGCGTCGGVIEQHEVETA